MVKQMKNDVSEELKTKIVKILEMGKRGGTQAEAELAMSKVHELLIKYNLSMSDIEAKEEKPAQPFTDHMVEDEDPRGVWRGCIWVAVSELYFCWSYRSTRVVYGLEKHYRIIVGQRDNVSTVIAVCKFLCDYGERLAKIAAESQPTGTRRSFINSFEKGFATEIYNRCRAEMRKAMAGELHDSETCRALVVVDQYKKAENAVTLWKKQSGLKFATRSSRGASNGDGYSAGKNAGQSVSLSGNSGKAIS